MTIKIGVPSKGRLRKNVLDVFKKNKYNLISERGERDYFAKIKNKNNVKIIYLHAREIIERLSDNSLDIGFSGYDLLKETPINIQKKISVYKKYNFGNAKLVVAIPNQWIDVQTIADLEEVAFEFKDSQKQRLRVATKYPNLTRDFIDWKENGGKRPKDPVRQLFMDIIRYVILEKKDWLRSEFRNYGISYRNDTPGVKE